MSLGLVCLRQRKNSIRQINFKLFQPTPADVCPISQELISDSELEWLQGVSFNPKEPQLKGIEIQCGHKFSALNLLYHWCRNRTVLCPVCRSGPKDARINMRTLPVHIRSVMGAKVREERSRDERERESEYFAAAQELQNDESWYYEYAMENVHLIVLYKSNERVQGFSCAFTSVVNVNDTCFFVAVLPASALRSLVEVKLHGCLSNSTRFPESMWQKIDNTTTRVDMSHPSSSCKYIVNFENDRVIITLSISMPLFKIIADSHEHIHNTMRIIGFI